MRDIDIEMFWTNNDRKSVVDKKHKRFKKNVKKYTNIWLIIISNNNAYHRTIEMKPVNVKSSTYIDFNAENNDKET